MIGLAALLVAAAGTASAAERYWPPIVDPPTGQYTPGRWVWGDLVTSDVATAADFYGAVFGWTFETYGGDATGDRQPAHEPSCAQAGAAADAARRRARAAAQGVPADDPRHARGTTPGIRKRAGGLTPCTAASGHSRGAARSARRCIDCHARRRRHPSAG